MEGGTAELTAWQICRPSGHSVVHTARPSFTCGGPISSPLPASQRAASLLPQGQAGGRERLRSQCEPARLSVDLQLFFPLADVFLTLSAQGA